MLDGAAVLATVEAGSGAQMHLDQIGAVVSHHCIRIVELPLALHGSSADDHHPLEPAEGADPSAVVWLFVVTVDDVRTIAREFERAYEVLVHDRVKFRVGQIVFVAFSRDEASMGFGFPKEERADLVASDPEKFSLPGMSDMRFNWVVVRVDAVELDELRELVVDAWRMVVPKKVAAAYDRRFALGLVEPEPEQAPHDG